MPGMTCVPADRGGRWAGGAVGRSIDEKFGMPGATPPGVGRGHEDVVELPEDTAVEAGRCGHLGYPEPEIFGSFMCTPERLASVGIFVPSWLGIRREVLRYLQHFMQHPYLWRYLQGGTCALAQSPRRSRPTASPFPGRDGYARIAKARAAPTC